MFVIARSRIADYDTWKRAFDTQVDARIRHGARGHHVFRAEQDGKELTVMIEVASYGGAAGLMNYDVAHLRAMERGRVEGCPHGSHWRIDYLDEVETADYTESSRFAAAIRETRSHNGFALRRPGALRPFVESHRHLGVAVASGKET